MAERPKAKRTPVLAFVGGVSQSIDALVEILEENLKMAQDAPLPKKISKATQKLKDSVGHLQRQIEETVSRSEEVGQEHTLSLVPLGRGSVPKAPLQALDVNEPIPVEAPPRGFCWRPALCPGPVKQDEVDDLQGLPMENPSECDEKGENELEEVVPMTSSGNVGFSTTSNEMGFSTTSGDMVMPRISEGCPSQFGGSMAKMPELDDEEEIHDFNFCILSPSWTSKMAWDFFVMFLVILDSIILPFQLSFKHGTPDDAFDEFWFWLTTIIFFTDVFLSFNTAVANPSEPGTWIMSRSKIAWMYLRGWFSIDFFSTIPYGHLAAAFGNGESAGAVGLLRMLKFLRIMRLMRMLRMSKLRAVWERVEVRIGSIAIIQTIMLMKVLLFVVAMCHWSACLFWVIGCQESLLTDLLPPESAAQFSQLQHWTTLPRRDSPYVGDAWTFAEKPMEEQYIFCFYWTLGVMRTMPAEVTPVNFPERIFVLLFMFFALSAFAVSVASLTQAYFKIFERGRTFNDEYFYVRMYLNRFGAQKPLEARVKQFLGHLFERRRIMAKETNLMDKLPEVLKHDVQNMLVWHHLQKLQLVSDLGKGAIQEICAASTIADHMPGVLLCTRGEVAESTWLLCSGRLQVYDEAEERWTSTTGKHRVTVIDYETLATPEPYHSTLTVSTATVCELLQISKAIFLKFAGHNQAETTRQWRKKQEQSNKGVIKVQFSGLENTEEQNTICASATTAVLMSGH